MFGLALVQLCLIVLVSSQQLGLDNNRIYSTNSEVSVNLVAQVNSSFQFPFVMKSNSIVSLWLLARQTSQSFKLNNSSLIDSLVIHRPGMVRSSNLTNAFNCLPSEDNCNQIRMPNFDYNQVGLYSFRYDSDNYLSTTTFRFNVSAFASEIKIDCVGLNGTCLSNNSVISVLADQPVMISCGIDVVQNDNYPLSAQFNFMLDTYEDCMGQNSTLSQFNSPISSNYNLLFKRLNKTCTTKFSIQDSSKKYKCILNPTPVSSTETAAYQTTATYQTLPVVLDVQYGPDPTIPLNPIPKSYEYLFNKTLLIGTQTNFSCPFIGNPTPNYYWRIVSSTINNNAANSSMRQSSDFSLSSQEYTISRNLQVGFYVFECKAQVLGLVNNYSQTIQFTLTVLPQPTPVVKNDNGTNVGAIVGGVIGGVALLAVIIIVISLYILYGRNKGNSKDEIEKAKDNKKSKKKPVNETNLENQETDTDIRPPENYGDGDEDDGGFKPVVLEGANTSIGEEDETIRSPPPPIPKTLPPSESSSFRQYNDLNENSSLANNKLAPWQSNQSRFQQLPILNLNTNLLNNQTPPTPKKRINNNTNDVDVNNNENLNLSSTSLSIRQNDERKPSTYKNLNDITTSATEFFHATNMGSSNGLNMISDPLHSTNNYGVYSPSNAEARHLEATLVADSNLSLQAKQAKQQLFSNNNNYSSKNNSINATTSNAQQLSIPKGAIKVLPSSTTPLKIINKQPIGNKVIAGLMVPNSTAQSYAAIAHAAAAAAQSNLQRNNYISNIQTNEPINFNSGSSNNLLINSNMKSQSYNNPGFFESIPNPLESPPPYESALHQPINPKKESPIEQQRLNQQQKDYMGSNSRLISEQNTPTQSKHAIAQSYTATPQHMINTANSTSITNTPNHVSSTLQQLGYQNQSNIQYTSVHNLGARSRNPLNGLPNEIESQTQYSTIAAQLSSNPIDV